MLKNQIPLIYHPTNVLFLDDEAIYLDRITHSLDDRIPYVKMTEPSAALEYLKKNCYQSDVFSALLTSKNFEQCNESEGIETFDVDFSKLSRQLNTADRFQKVMVVFVDQVMGKMKGLDFCEKVREAALPVKLVLLTGNTEEEEVIHAFNNGLINCYLPKSEKKLSEKINEQAFLCCREQFIQLSQQLLGFIAPLMKPLYEKGFLAFFENVLKERNCHEFYLLDSGGSFLLLNDDGQASLLNMHKGSDFKHYYDIAEDSGASKTILQLIKNKQKVPVKPFYDKGFPLEGDEWPDIMQNCQQAIGRELYYSLIDEPMVKAFGFKRYLDEVWLKKT